MPGWDYSGSGHYFVTIVTQNRVCNLGKIKDSKMILSDFGKIIETEWYKSFKIRNELFLDEFIIMPNHIHAIIVLEKPIDEMIDGTDGTHVETHGRASLQSTTVQPTEQSKFIRKPKSISSFIAGYKSAINSKIDDYIDDNNLDIPKYNRNNHFFQQNYNDHIIRNNTEYHKIKIYIINNPSNWKNDKFNE